MTKHSPAPWFQAHDRIYNEPGDDIARMFKSETRSDEESQANAALILAAPELLFALECLEIFMRDTDPDAAELDVWAQARAAISKARGE